MTGSFSGAALAWDDFSMLYFPERRRHDLEALASYAANKREAASPDGSQLRRAKLTLVPNEPEPDGFTAGAGTELHV